MWGKLKHTNLYLMVLVFSLALVVISLGGGLFQQGGLWIDHWQHRVFQGICHQHPLRSFWMNGTPMAVCTRCFGIYASFASAWLVVPVLLFPVNLLGDVSKKVLIGVVVLNVVDVAGNTAGLWQNTGLSRFSLGAALGISAVLVLSKEFLPETEIKEGKNYGKDR